MARVFVPRAIDNSKSSTRRVRSRLEDSTFLGALFLAPAVAYIIILVGIPFGLALAFSVSDVTVGDTSLDFVGL